MTKRKSLQRVNRASVEGLEKREKKREKKKNTGKNKYAMLQQATLKEKKAVGERKQEKKEGERPVYQELTSASLMSLLLYQALPSPESIRNY